MDKKMASGKTETVAKVIRGKLDRLKRGGRPRVLDLFAGCGGISLGFHSAGFEVIGAVEIDEAAARSHALNFHRCASPDLFEEYVKPRDITVIEPDELIAEFGLTGPADAHIDVIVGGPPCQAFARVGRAKLREVAEHP
ncbi:MAG: DNA cytosine methyltransferase, partial [Caldilinea sp.]